MTRADDPAAPPRPEAATAGSAVPTVAEPAARPPRIWGTWSVAALFLLPALLILGALVVYPIFFTIVRSLYDRPGDTFVGLDNYREMFDSPRTLRAVKNNAVWVAVAPTVVTAVGLVLAVLTERIRWATAFKFLLFMPLAISFLAAGVIFRVVYQDNPDVGVANATLTGVVEVFRPPGDYPGARSALPEALEPEGRGFRTTAPVTAGETSDLPLIAISPALVPDDAQPAAAPSPERGAITGVVWLDFAPGGGGERGEIDPDEPGLPGIRVQAVAADGSVVASDTTDAAGRYVLEVAEGDYDLRLTDRAFREPWGGLTWLGPSLVTPAIIGSYVWIWAGFAMVVIGAGLAAIPRDTLEAARMDGASELQVFRRVTAPLLMPVLLVVIVTLMINVLKIFDLVLVIAPPSSQDDANVLALEMWRVSFGGARNQGLGSALAVFLFVLVIPAMAFNIRRFRVEQ